MASDSEILEFIRARTSGPTILVPVLAIIALACGLLFVPCAWKPYIAISGSEIAFETPSFHHIEITLADQTRIQQYIVSQINVSSATNGQTSTSTTVAVDTEEKLLSVSNPFYTRKEESAQNDVYYHVTIFLESPRYPEIEDVTTDGVRIRLKDFRLHNLKSQGQYHRIRYVREELSYGISSLNNSISNFVLALLCAGISALFVKLVQMECWALYSKKHFKKYLIRHVRVKSLKSEQQRNDAFAKYAAYWAVWEKRFRFFQALGPAVGFLLTVSSLIEALQPSAVVVSDLSPFLAGIHIAMVSTFLGLLLRILALEASRVNSVLLDKAAQQISKAEEANDSAESPIYETAPH